jgi:hypothetical protein
MPWDRSQPSDPKYRSREHRAYVAHLKQRLRFEGVLWCTAAECLFESRAITNSYGRDDDGLTAGHADNGVDYDGPQHRACNVRDGARRGNARSRKADTPRRWVM